MAGHSLGGISIAAWAAGHEVRDRAAGAVLVNTGVDDLIGGALVLGEIGKRLNPRRLGRALLGSSATLPPLSTPVQQAAIRHIAFGPTATSAQIAFYERMLLETPASARAATGIALSDLQLATALERLTIPTSVIAGDRDRLTPLAHSEQIAAGAPGARGADRPRADRTHGAARAPARGRRGDRRPDGVRDEHRRHRRGRRLMKPLGTLDRGQMQVCYPLQEDPELAEAIEPDQRAAASTALIARQLEISPGAWPGSSAGRDGIGLLVLQGTLVLRVGIAGRHSAELIGEGDVLRRPDTGWATQLTLTHSWLVLEPARLAVLDSRFASQLGGFPNLTGALFGRASLRTRQLAVNMAIVHQARVDVRLHMLLWHLAGRWGRVRSDGIVVALRLTHSILAELVAARRPTVTSALSELSRNGLVRSVPEGWLLCGPPPGAPEELDLALADEPRRPADAATT